MDKMSFGTPRRWRATTLAGTLFFVICGLMLLIWPNEALAIANYALAITLLLIGILGMIGYLKASPMSGALGFSMSLSLISITAGILLICMPSLLAALLPFLWGVALVAGGFMKIQMSSDMRRMGVSRWWLILIAAIFSFVLGVMAILRPTLIAMVATQFIGISLLVEAVVDFICTFVLNRKMKMLFPEIYNS